MAKTKYMLILAVAMAMLLCVAGCGTPEETIPPNETVYQYSISASSAEDLAILNNYPNLTEVNLRGSSCYKEILAYMEANPLVEVSYDVQIGESRYDHTVTELTLEDGTFDAALVAENLVYLPSVQTIDLPKTSLTAEQIALIQRSAPDALITYSVMLLGEELASDTVELDLSALLPEQVDQITATLAMLPKLTSVELMSGSASNLSPADVKKLMAAVPEVEFSYEFELFGQQVSTAQERLEFLQTRIGDDGAAMLREAMDIMPALTYLSVDRCGVSTETMASIREDYPDVKVAWRIFFGKFSCMTDEETLRLTNGLEDHMIDQLQYCNDAKYLDIGHNEELTDISFIKYMPKLEILILSGSIVQDISVFQDHQNIEFMELCYCPRIEDISSLANCPNLKYLNISFTKVTDISATDNLPMGRLVALGTNISKEDQAHFLELHPDCLYRFEGEQCYGYAWRYDDYGYTFSDYYRNMRVIFNYDDVGWYTGQGIFDTGY